MHRRTLYTFMKRNAQFPSLMVFDMADRNVSTVARKISNTPLQALVLLNDPQYHGGLPQARGAGDAANGRYGPADRDHVPPGDAPAARRRTSWKC